MEDRDIATLFGDSQHLDVKISAGKGGAFFLKNTQDPSLLIKSMTPGEYEVIKNFTENFYLHLLDNPDSLVAPILGIYVLDDDSIDPIYFMLMKSVFDTKTLVDRQKLAFFDLKGSTEGRNELKSEAE